jgi:dTDP-4-amino-4,6-dideoxygalactose transaminase
MKHIPLAKPYFTEEEVDEVREVLRSGWVAQGPKVKAFEEIIASYSSARHGIAVNSCTSALHLSLLAHDVSEGDKVIIPDFTFTATGNVVLHVGAEPIIVDIDLSTFCIDLEGIEKAIEKDVKAILPVHAFGYPANIRKINQIAKRHGLIVIEDAALALGSEFEGKKIGSFGNTACFSLQGRKVITTGEGGIALTSDDRVAETLRALRSQGASPGDNVSGKVNLPIFKIMGFSYRLSDIQAVIGLVQMKRIEDFIKRRIYLAEYYDDLFEDTNLNIQTPMVIEGNRHNYQTYVVMLEGNRDEMILHLKEKGIESTIGTYSLSTQPIFQKNKTFPNSYYAFKHSLALPMYHELTEEDIQYIVKNIKNIINDII